MDSVILTGVIASQQREIHTENGPVFHGLRGSESCFHGFGEAYFSEVYGGSIKGWKCHRDMTMNLFVLRGAIRFYLVNQATNESSKVLVSDSENLRLTINPGVWVAFEGMTTERNLLLNLARIEHDPSEALTADLERFMPLFVESPE